MKKKIVSVILSSILTVAMMTSSVSVEATSTEAPAAEGEETVESKEEIDYSDVKICYANAMDSAAMFAGIGDNVRDTCEKAGIELVYFDNDNDAEKVISNAKLMVQ